MPSPEVKRSKGGKRYIRRLVGDARREPNPEFSGTILPILKAKIPDFDEQYGRDLRLIEDIWDARKNYRESGSFDKIDALSKDYSEGGLNYDPKDPDRLERIAPATRVIVEFFKGR